MRFVFQCFLLYASLSAAYHPGVHAGEESPYPKWDGKESVEQYAQRANLPASKVLDLGDGVKLETVLVPAGDFLMGAAEPRPVDVQAFEREIQWGRIVLGATAGMLVLIALFLLIRALFRRSRPQYSLRVALALMLVASAGIWGGTHWWKSFHGLQQAQAAYQAALAGYNDANDDEKPARQVTLARPFYMGKYHVTQAQYQKVAGTNPSRFTGPDLPVDKVSWEAAKEFCRTAARLSGQPVRLPTEAEWEFACRAGTGTLYYSGEHEPDLERVAWYYKNSDKSPHPVGQKAPNKFGLYDMLGNNWQWCQKYNPQARAEEQPDVPPDSVRVVRGGSWDDAAKHCRATSVFRYFPDYRPLFIGLRIIVPITPAQ